MLIIDKKIEIWKKSLLDFGRRNQLYSFKETKRTTLKINKPEIDTLYDDLVIREKVLSFSFTERLEYKINKEGEEEYNTEIVRRGDLDTNRTFNEQQKTLAQLRSRTKMAREEQGINILYLSFGLLKWTENSNTNQEILSPIFLVPVTLLLESISSPYKISLHEDEIVINPTLIQKLSNDFGIQLPELEEQDCPSDYFRKLRKVIARQQDWNIIEETYLSLLSFLKINMYKDLEKHKELIKNNDVISAITGNGYSIEIPQDYFNFDHDSKTSPIDTFQILDADSSQQDAILLAKKGISFVLQGPPGTGKSQTITNIIAEVLADGKKVLFVSEKNAALEVVYNRLKSAGLSEFCLAIHSHKANKKEILKELLNTLQINRNYNVKEEATLKLEELREKREKLNRYQSELHTIVEPLNKTIFQINGELAKLAEVPEIIFQIHSIDKISYQEFNRWRRLLDDYSKTVGQSTGDYRNNPWYNCSVPMVTHELRHDIDFHLDKLIPVLTNLSSIINDCLSKFELPFLPTWENISNIVVVLSIARESPVFPQEWITDWNIQSLKEDTVKRQKIFTHIKQEKQNLLSKYEHTFLDKIDVNDTYSRLTEAINKLESEVKPDFYKENITEHILEILSYAQQIISSIEKIKELQTINDSLFDGIIAPMKDSDFKEYINVLTNLKENPNPTQCWFTSSHFERKEKTNLLSFAQKKYEEENKLRNEIQKDFDLDILQIDANDLLKKFRTEYNTIFRWIKASYRKDIKTIRSFYKGTDKLTYTSAISILSTIKQYKERLHWIDDNKEKLKEFFGNNFIGQHTDWNLLLRGFNAFCTIYDSPIVTLTDNFRNLLIDGKLPIDKIEGLLSLIRDNNLDSISIESQSLSSRLNNTSDIISISIKINSIIEHCHTCESILKEFNTRLFTKEGINYDTIKVDLETLIKIKEHEKEIKNTDDELRECYGQYWDEYNTDWDKVIVAIEYADKFKEITRKYELSEPFIKKISSDISAIEETKILLKKIQDISTIAHEHYNWFCNIFNDEEKISSHTFEKNILRIQKCRDNKELLDEWIEFRNVREECKKTGMANFITALDENEIPSNKIIGTFLKRFYRLWLDAVLPNFMEVGNFRTKKHEELIKEFAGLDKEQQIIAKQRITQKLISKLPDVNRLTNARDENAILQRELSKQRRIMPLRRLFKSIPNLMTTLKPCFMMSPLSVSIFLEADSYKFDLVIFDEASQVCTENAIGAIMRSKQTIIVGDSKQMPPTNFFNATLDPMDFDNEDEEEDNDTGAYESILDEAVTALPERSLLWHYRSKHEHLIAFSNTKIYNNRLITFPSSIEKKPGVGVEYIYVRDGVYERGSNRRNIPEAKKVCDLIFEHFRTTPTKSLGVVTFSESQQHTIENEIRLRLLQDSSYEQFFNEENEEPFFIKNLENVQGDERDTIIFSIGYAKDAYGVMYMNFGPLSKNGGHRRLNVAITRAKYNIKLVGSILPTDLGIGEETKEGVKLLRSYIDFAIRGIVAIEGEISLPNIIETESPFEESVYDFLVSNGYKVATQVGCSGYRIDMAVKHPDYKSAYVMGIECDGATYHSSRTARERDRLRQSVLEDMGWKIYRIWSTDWIKDPKAERQRLLGAVQNAIDNFMIDIVSEEGDGQEQLPENNYVEIEIKDLFEDIENVGYGFMEYISADPFGYFNNHTSGTFNDRLAGAIEYVVSIEQPIHKKLIYKKMAPLLGNDIVTNRIVESIDQILSYNCKNINEEYEILTLKDWDRNIQVRIASEGEKQRDIGIFPQIELIEAVKIIVSKSYGIEYSALITETARTLGYGRTGPNITVRIKEAIDFLLNKSIIKDVNNKIIF